MSAAPPVAAGAGLGVTTSPGPHPLRALDDHLFAGGEARLDNPDTADAGADRDGLERKLVVAADHGDVVQALQLLHGPLRHEQRVLPGLEDEADAAVLAGPDQAAGIREPELHRERARRGIDGPLDRVEPALLRVDRAVGEDEIDGHRLTAARLPELVGAPRDAKVLRLADASREQDGSIWDTVVSSVLSPRPTRLPDLTSVVPTSPLIGEVTLVYPRSSRALSTDALCASTCALAASWFATALSSSCWLTAWLAASGLRRFTSFWVFASRACAVARSALALASVASNGLRIDAIEELPFPNERAFLERHDLEEALDTRADLDVLRTLGLAHELGDNGHVALLDGGDEDLGRRRRGGRRFSTTRAREQNREQAWGEWDEVLAHERPFQWRNTNGCGVVAVHGQCQPQTLRRAGIAMTLPHVSVHLPASRRLARGRRRLRHSVGTLKCRSTGARLP